jgi:hypothetical protein
LAESELWALPTEYKAAASAWTDEAVDVLSRQLHPLLASVRRERVADLPWPENHSPETADLASPSFRGIEASHVVTADFQDAIAGEVDPFLAMVFELADAFGSQMTQGMLAHISEVCDASGQTIDAAGRDFIEVIIETLETIEMSFDEDGKPNLTLVVPPGSAEKLRNKMPTPEQEERIQQILERRRAEWDASRSRHDLP